MGQLIKEKLFKALPKQKASPNKITGFTLSLKVMDNRMT